MVEKVFSPVQNNTQRENASIQIPKYENYIFGALNAENTRSFHFSVLLFQTKLFPHIYEKSSCCEKRWQPYQDNLSNRDSQSSVENSCKVTKLKLLQ